MVIRSWATRMVNGFIAEIKENNVTLISVTATQLFMVPWGYPVHAEQLSQTL
jgi:hypothetical protein